MNIQSEIKQCEIDIRRWMREYKQEQERHSMIRNEQLAAIESLQERLKWLRNECEFEVMEIEKDRIIMKKFKIIKSDGTFVIIEAPNKSDAEDTFDKWGEGADRGKILEGTIPDEPWAEDSVGRIKTEEIDY